MNRMSMLISKQDDVTIAMPGERLDTATALEAETELIAQVSAGATRVVVDFSKTAYISSAGLRVLLRLAKVLMQKSGKLALCNANGQIHEVLEISGFVTMLSYCATLAEAIAATAGE
jgi:anti-sigma B factor antagonist